MVSEIKINDSMKIILHAGNARTHCMNALKLIEQVDFQQAKGEMKLANEEIVKAHHIQTNAIQDETQGMTGEYSVLFAHAQDTLMTVYSEINLTKRLLRIFSTYGNRLKILEDKLLEDKGVDE